MPQSETEKVFTRIYARKAWGASESVSGPGSGVARTGLLRPRLAELLKKLGVVSILDLPCGDFNWMRLTELPGIEYTGADVVAKLIEQNRLLYTAPGRTFLQIDMLCDPIPRSDLILCRDALVHLSFFDMARALQQMQRSGATYLLTTSFTALERNDDILTGDWRFLNLSLAPLCFPAPIETISDARPDGTFPDKVLALYRFADLAERVRELQSVVRKKTSLRHAVRRSLQGIRAVLGPRG